MDQLKADLQSDDYETRTKSVKNLRAVAQAVGPQRTRDELIPFLNGAF
jgi:hypothetical protein